MKMLRTIPGLPVVQISAAVIFYRDRMGFTCAYQDDVFARLMRDEAELHLWAAADVSWKGRDVTASPIVSGAETFLAGTSGCRIEVTEIDTLYAELKGHNVLYDGNTVVRQMPWGTREFPALDLHRNLITFFEKINAQV